MIESRRLAVCRFSKSPAPADRVAGGQHDVVLDRAPGLVDKDLGGVSLGDALMAPTTIYVKPMLELLREQADSVHGMAHITGGGLKENIIRVVPEGLGLQLDAAAIVLPPVFEWLMREGNVAREEMWRTFNCGVGFTVILPRDGVRRRQCPAGPPRPGQRGDRRGGDAAGERARADRLSRLMATREPRRTRKIVP